MINAMTRRTLPLTIKTAFAGVALLGTAVLTGCSSSTKADLAQTVPANADITVLAQDAAKFDQKTYTAKAGEVKLAYISQGNQVHNLIIEDANKAKLPPTLKVAPGQKVGGTYTLAAGTYAMYCDIPGHKQSMNAVLTIT
jgi:plastocyanin